MMQHPDSVTDYPTTEAFNWELVAQKAKTERDLAFLRKREAELSTPVTQLYGSLDSGRQDKLKKIRKIIATKESYLGILLDAIQNH